jgi:hypothetical protein
MQRQIITVLAILCAFFASGYGQTGTAGATAAPPIHSPDKQAAAATGDTNAPKANPSAVGMDQAVITLQGGCEPEGGITPAKACVKTVTRAEFERIATALQPNMADEAKRGFATNYGRLLIYADAARGLQLENDPNVQQIIQFVTNQVLADGLRRHYAEAFAHPSEQQIQDYYTQNSGKYLEAKLQRIIIPHEPSTGDKPTANEAEEKAAAEKARQRWVAGEDPVKIQQSAFEAAGVKGNSTPEIDIGPRLPGSLPVDQEGVFQLKAGEISQVYSDPAASYVYKVVSVRTIPLSEVKDSISKILQQQQLQDKLQAIGKSATPVLNDEYFGPPPAAPAAGSPAAGRQPAGGPPSSNPPK